MRADFDAELVQEHLAHRAAGHPGHRFPGARALQDVARVLAVVLEGAREIRVARPRTRDRKSTRLNSSHSQISYAVFCLKKKNQHLDVDDVEPVVAALAGTPGRPLRLEV